MSVLEKASLAIDLLARSREPVRLGVLSEELGMPKSSAHRLLTELTALRILRRTADGQFALGPRLLAWGSRAADSFVIRGVAEPWMRKLRDITGESVHLYVRQDTHRLCLASVEGFSALRPVVPMGGRQPLGIGSAGKLLLAFAPKAVVEAVVEDAARSGRRTASNDELDAIHAEHWTIAIDEREKGLSGAATSVRGIDGSVLAAISVSGSSLRLTAERFLEIRGDLVACAAEIAEAMTGRERDIA
ncbi:IclR family transcriptional regulator [Streptomyces sp. NPDC002577]